MNSRKVYISIFLAAASMLTQAHPVTFRNVSAGRIGFYYYTAAFESVEFYIQPRKTFTFSLEEPCWITQLSLYQTPYHLNTDIDTLLITTDEKGIAHLTPPHDDDPVQGNELNAFGFVSHRVPKTENQILFEILSKRDYREIDKIITDRYDHNKELLGTYLRTHVVSKQYAALAYGELLLSRHFYQLLWIGATKIKFVVPPSYEKQLDSLSGPLRAETAQYGLGLPAYRADYLYFIYHCRQLSPGDTSSLTAYTTALKEIKDQRELDKILFFIVKDELTDTTRNQNALVQRFFSDCRNIIFIHSIREKLDDNLVRLSIAGNDGMMTLTKERVNFIDVLKSNTGKLVYIDLWASWCAPCRAEMPAAEQLRKIYKDQPIAFIYISADHDPAAWKMASEQEKLSQLRANYVLANFEASDIKKKYNITTLPRYLLFGKNNDLINADAPRPSDPSLKVSLDKLLAK